LIWDFQWILVNGEPQQETGAWEENENGMSISHLTPWVFFRLTVSFYKEGPL
jgi:hypothetical protein